METKKEKLVSAVATIGIVLMLFGATYAYFISRSDAGKTTDVEITANTVDVFSFETGDPISLSLDQDNFASGKGNQTGETFAKAILSANNKTNTATEHYYLYLNIDSNTFYYTSEDNKPEILVKITKNGTEVTSGISNLTYASVTDASSATVTGFDITNKTGLIKIADNTEITTTSTTTDEWKFYVTFVNYDYDQTDNAGKSFSADIFIQRDVIPQVIGDVCDSGGNLAECLKVLTINSTPKYTNLYLHDSSLKNGAGDNSYRYSGTHDEVNNFVCFGSDEETCPDDNLYRIIGVFENQVKLIKWDYATSELLGTDGDYSTDYASKMSSNSWSLGISKGTNAQSSIGAYWWDIDAPLSFCADQQQEEIENKFGRWSYSKLNTVNLNTNFINNIEITWANKIATTTWKVGKNYLDNIVFSAMYKVYQKEIVSPPSDTIYSDEIGLMYVSDYGYAASPVYWTYPLLDGNGSWNDGIWSGNDYMLATSLNWMYMGLKEWTITSLQLCAVCFVDKTGFVIYDNMNADTFALGIRPAFYLESSVNYVSGSGTKTNPIIID